MAPTEQRRPPFCLRRSIRVARRPTPQVQRGTSARPARRNCCCVASPNEPTRRSRLLRNLKPFRLLRNRIALAATPAYDAANSARDVSPSTLQCLRACRRDTSLAQFPQTQLHGDTPAECLARMAGSSTPHYGSISARPQSFAQVRSATSPHELTVLATWSAPAVRAASSAATDWDWNSVVNWLASSSAADFELAEERPGEEGGAATAENGTPRSEFVEPCCEAAAAVLRGNPWLHQPTALKLAARHEHLWFLKMASAMCVELLPSAPVALWHSS
mmetsp:Transcript_11293/g.31413  ORF Transcript_11293/g.31413 Transcript_11293/m.31413 type:complete len:275 (+) Transcript_11293:1145-1969(+)